jgi:hypothetical protein
MTVAGEKPLVDRSRMSSRIKYTHRHNERTQGKKKIREHISCQRHEPDRRRADHDADVRKYPRRAAPRRGGPALEHEPRQNDVVGWSAGRES